MFHFEAVIRPQFAERICDDLLEWGMVDDLIACEVVGSGRRWVAGEGDYVIDMLPKVLVAGAVEDERVDELVDRICTGARTGRSGDGKVYLRRIDSFL